MSKSKNKVKLFTQDMDGYSLQYQIAKWQRGNPGVNIVSTQLYNGSFTTIPRMTVIYNYEG